jgi:DNA-binding transcriptional regulator LsrR (DeoR family)
VTDVTGMVSPPASQRQRITGRLQAEVIKHYEQGMSSRRVAAALGLGRTTVLRILKMAEVEVRPRGRKY